MPRYYSRSQGRIVEAPSTGEIAQPGALGSDSVIDPQNADMLKQLLLMSALQDPKNVSKYSGISSLLGDVAPGPTAEEKKQLKTKGDLDRRLSVVEKLWFPNEDKLAIPEKSTAVGRFAHKVKKRYEASSEYELFRRQTKTLGATLAKAAGDTGNIAWAEQAAQLQALADADLTKEEAEIAFGNVREALGISKGSDYYDALRKGEKPREEAAAVSDRPIPPGTTPLFPEGLGASPAAAELETEPSKKTTQDDIIDVGLPDVPYTALGGALGSLFGYPGTALGTATGKTLKQIQERGLPKTREAYEREYGGQAQQLKEVAGPAAAASALRFLLTPFSSTRNLLGGIRKGVGAGKTIPGAAIPEAGVKHAATQTAGKPTLEKLVARDVERFGGQQVSLQEAIKEATRRGAKGYSLSGHPSRAVTGGYLQQTERALRELISQQSPAAGALTKAMGSTNAVQRALSNLLRPLLYAGGGIGAGAIIGKALGQK